MDLSGWVARPWVARPLGGTPAGWHALSAAKGVVCCGRAKLILNFASPKGNLSVVVSPVKTPHGLKYFPSWVARPERSEGRGLPRARKTHFELCLV